MIFVYENCFLVIDQLSVITTKIKTVSFKINFSLCNRFLVQLICDFFVKFDMSR